MAAAFERIFLDAEQINLTEASRAQLLEPFFAKWKRSNVELMVFTDGQAAQTTAELERAGVRQYIEEVISTSVPKYYATKGARLLMGLKVDGWVPRDQIVVDSSSAAIQSVWLDEVGEPRRCTLAHTFRFVGSQRGISEEELRHLDRFLFEPTGLATRHVNLFQHQRQLILDTMDCASKALVDSLPPPAQKGLLLGLCEAELRVNLLGRPDLAARIGVAPVLPEDIAEPKAPAKPAGSKRPPVGAAAPPGEFVERHLSARGADAGGAEHPALARDATRSGIVPDASRTGRGSISPKPSALRPSAKAGSQAPYRKTRTLNEYEVTEGLEIQIQGGPHDGKSGVVLKVMGDPGSKRYRVEVEDGTATWATKVRAFVGGGDAMEVEQVGRPQVVSPLMAALTGAPASGPIAPKGGGKGARAPPPPSGGLATKASMRSEQEQFPEGTVVEVIKGMHKGKIGTVVKIQGEGREKKWRVQIEAGGPCSWVEGVEASSASPKDAPKVAMITDFYDVDKKRLGSGAYGSVTKVVSKATGLTRAMKTIPKPMVKRIEDIWREVDYMKRLDHPNIIKVYDSFEDQRSVYLIMELCLGGELFDRIIEMGFFSEGQAAVVMQNALRGVYYMHSKQICHRDLKPENFLLTSKDAVDATNLKIIDFGLAHDFPAPGTFLRTRTGSAYYIAPQVLAGEYDELADMWSFGVILYTILCGYPPFQGETDPEIMANVKLGKFSFPEAEWGGISSEAKGLISKLLTFDPKARCSAEEAMRHVWMTSTAPKAITDRRGSIVSNLRVFQSHNKIKKVALQLIANQMSEEQIKGLRDTFQALDENQDGLITTQELASFIRRVGVVDVPPDLRAVIDQVGSSASGSIDYTEFLAATLDRKMYQQEDLCWAAFRSLDKDGDGKLCKDDVIRALQETKVKEISHAELGVIMAKLDLNGDGLVDFQEFMAMIRS